jgi:hypothetical protein
VFVVVVYLLENSITNDTDDAVSEDVNTEDDQDEDVEDISNDEEDCEINTVVLIFSAVGGDI